MNVDSADDTIARVEANGGTVYVAPMDVMEAGRMAVFADPAGAVIGLWQPNQHMGAQLVNEPGTYCWSELMTEDLAGAETFYGAVFGWAAERQGPEGHGGYTEWKVGGRSVGGMMAPPPQMPAGAPPFWGVYFAVADADAVVAKAQAAWRIGDDAADRHRTGALRGAHRPGGSGVQRPGPQGRAAVLTRGGSGGRLPLPA